MKSSGDSGEAACPLAILSAPGSRGDVNPMIAIGRALRQRGWDVVISLAEPYAPLAVAAGLSPQSLISQERFDQLLAAASVWKPLSGIRTILQGAACDFLRPHFELITRLNRPGRTILVSHPLDFASRIHRELDPSTPLVDIFLAPALVRSPTAPPRLSPWWYEPRAPAWLVSTTYRLADHLLLDRFLASSVNRLRREHALRPVRRIMDRWWLSPDLVLGMYPSWFSSAAPATSGEWQTCGFPRADSERADSERGSGEPAPATADRRGEAGAWAARRSNTRSDREAIFFTPGTAHRHAQSFFAIAIEACRMLDRPAILATTHAAQIPPQLPPTACAVGYVPLAQTLPSCAAIVHHGGIGTTAQAMAAACPQLILPMAFDQFDNAQRVVQLGLGGRLLRPSAQRLAAALQDVLGDRQRQLRCDAVAARVAADDGAQVAADRIVSLLAKR